MNDRLIHGGLWIAASLALGSSLGCSDGHLQRDSAGTGPGELAGTPAMGAGENAAAQAPASPQGVEGSFAAPPLGQSAAGGRTSAPAAEPSQSPAADAQAFELLWQDDFDALDLTRWQLMTHSWDTNLAQFSTENTRIENGILSLLLTREPADTVKPFRGVELRSREALTYGKVEARVRLARGSGVVSSIVLIYTPWPADNWNELDVEYLGRYSDRVQFNAMVYTGPPVQAPVQQSVMPTQYPQLVTLPFDPTQDFNVFSMEWTPMVAKFSVNGGVLHEWSTEIGRMTLPQNILLTIWASSSAVWAGPIVEESAPTSADYDWIRVYRWQG